VHSFLGDVIKNVTEREEAFGGVDEVCGALCLWLRIVISQPQAHDEHLY
jgi:hypothetical protein